VWVCVGVCGCVCAPADVCVENVMQELL